MCIAIYIELAIFIQCSYICQVYHYYCVPLLPPAAASFFHFWSVYYGLVTDVRITSVNSSYYNPGRDSPVDFGLHHILYLNTRIVVCIYIYNIIE